MEKGFRILVAGWIVVLGLVTAGLASYNDHLDSLPGCVTGDMCDQELPESCRHGATTSEGILSPLRHTWLMIFRSLEFPCDGAILNVSMAINVSVQEQQGFEVQVWRFYSNNSLMLVQWAEPRRIECIGCTKTPMYLSMPLSFRKGDVLGIYRNTVTAKLSFSTAVPQSVVTASKEALVLSVTASSIDGIHQLQGRAVTTSFLRQYSDGFDRMSTTFAQAYPLIELELSFANEVTPTTGGVDTSTVNLATPSPTALPPQQSPNPVNPSNKLNIFTMAIIVSIVSVAFVAISVVMLSVVVVLCLRRCRLSREPTVKESEPVAVKETPAAEIICEYDEVSQTFLPASGSMMSSVASLARGRYEVNQTEDRVPSLDNISGPTLDCSLVSDGSGPLPSNGFDHDYSAVGPAANPTGDYDLPEESQVPEDVYVHPPCTENELYSHLSCRHYEAIDRKYIEFVRCVGVGEFGRVCMGYWNTKGYRRKVAIKTLNLQAEEKDRIRFLQEAAIMAQFRHPNIVNLFGVVKEGEPKMIVLELMDMGDLRGVLMDAKSALGETTSKDLSVLLLKFSRQISDGMDYLAKKCFIHRDLAARNILVTDDYVCKIGDFGLARDLVYDSYYLSSGGLVPVRWTAPEALIFGRFSSASDVWSFAALLYEIWSLGHKPFEDVDNQEVVQLVQTGHRLPPPPGCPRMVYSIMISCWHPQAHLRPDFSDVRGALRQSQMNILQWASEDMSEDLLSLHLGAPLIHGKDLFIDLQNTYLQAEMGSI